MSVFQFALRLPFWAYRNPTVLPWILGHLAVCQECSEGPCEEHQRLLDRWYSEVKEYELP